MEKILLIFLYFAPEAALIFFVGLGLIGYKLPLKKLLFISFVQGCIIFVVRWIYHLNNISLGTHTILLMLTMVLLLKYSAGISLGAGTAATFTGITLAALGDLFLLVPFGEFINTKIGEVFQESITKHVLAGYLSGSFLIIAALLHWWTKFKLIDLAKLEGASVDS